MTLTSSDIKACAESFRECRPYRNDNTDERMDKWMVSVLTVETMLLQAKRMDDYTVFTEIAWT